MITVNGKEVKSSYILKENDKIDIEEYNEEMLILEQKREEKMQFIFKKTVLKNISKSSNPNTLLQLRIF